MDISATAKLGLLSRRREKNRSLSLGFNHYESISVAAIIGVLVTFALPHFGSTGVSLEAGVRVGEAISIARECASYVVSTGSEHVPTTTPNRNGRHTCDKSGGSVVSGTWSLGAGGVKCLGVTSTVRSTHATITITGSGDMRCTFGPMASGVDAPAGASSSR